MPADWVKHVEGCQAQRHGNYKLAEDYYEGRHKVKVPLKVRQWIEQNYSFRGNLADVVVDALAERLIVTGFDCADGKMAAQAWDWWRQNRMDHDSRVVHKEAAKYADFYVLVDWDPVAKRPRYTHQTPFQLYPRYVDRVLQYAVKVWEPDDNTRRYTVYYPDRVERYVAIKGRSLFGNGKYMEPVPYGSPAESIQDWTDRDGRPLGVPVIHFRNNAQSDDWGRPEAAQVIPIQDLLNKTLVDLALVMDTMGWPQRWATGPTPFGHEWSAAPGRVWKSDDPDAKFGQFDAADPQGLLDTCLFLINFAAGRSRTPQHLFHITGDYPTGEALKTAEAGFIAKVEDRATAFGTYWEQVNHLAFRLDNTFGTGRWNPDQVMDTLWRPYELRNEQAHAQAIATLSGFYPRKALWRMNGATPMEVAQLEAEWQEQQDADQQAAQTRQEGFLSAFDRGDS